MNRNILVVDDEVGIRLLLEDLLAADGYTVYTAQTGKEALELINLHKIDLMIIDYKLPIIDGIEVIKQLDRDNKQIKIVLMSGLAESLTDEIYQLSSITKVLSKPFDVMEFKGYINQLLAD
ncbi:response regulator [Ornithinibacillus sp. FSL M8-0202]|uniref:response regulator n=1 Tax=unclassified Ornithinibacillus TaxID=2620869 RepID=UPI0030D40C64